MSSINDETVEVLGDIIKELSNIEAATVAIFILTAQNLDIQDFYAWCKSKEIPVEKNVLSKISELVNATELFKK